MNLQSRGCAPCSVILAPQLDRPQEECTERAKIMSIAIHPYISE
jgi:hypothetical protein